MVSKELVKYVKEHFGLGMSSDDVRIELLKQGRPAADIDSAIMEAGGADAGNKEEVQRQGPSAVTKVFVVITILAAVGIVLFFVFAKMNIFGGQEITDISEVPEIPEQEPVAALPEKEEPVVPEAPVLPPEDETKQEPPETVPEPAVPIPPVQTGVEIPEYNLSLLDFGLTERLEYIQDISTKNPDASISMCADYVRTYERDLCFATIARSIPDFVQCGRIAEQMLRDQCYLSFAVSGTDTCARINDTDVKEACTKLVEISLAKVLQ